jgi:putative FmdB family regulatory protein
MPIYEYECRSCDAQFQSLIMKNEEEESLACPKCRPSASKNDSFYRDSRNIGLNAKKKAEQMGVDLGTGFEEKLEKLRTDPGSVIKDSE